MKVVVIPLHMYIDLGKNWYVVKPIEPVAPMFYEFAPISAKLMDVNPGDSIERKILNRVYNGESVTIIPVNDPTEFQKYLTEGDDKVPFPPHEQAETVQLAAEKKLDEILASPFVTHQVTKNLCEALRQNGDFFSHKDIQYIDSLYEIMLDKAGVKHDESD